MRQVVAALVLAATAVHAQGPAVPVTVDNFVRAETDMYFGAVLKDSGGVGRFVHRREVASVDHQTVVRLNRDTLYSSALFDLEAGPVAIVLPEAGRRFRSMMVVNQDHYVQAVVYAAGTHTFTRKAIGTRYMVVALRTLVDPNSPDDVKEAHALQDAVKVQQAAAGTFEAPNWDPASQKVVRDALLVLGATIADFTGAFGSKAEVDPIRHLLGTAGGWGGNPSKDAIYLNVVPPRNDGTTVAGDRHRRLEVPRTQAALVPMFSGGVHETRRP
jgi:hypothetical protein